MQPEKNILNEEKKFLKDAEEAFKHSKTYQRMTNFSTRLTGENRAGIYINGALIYELKRNSNNFSLDSVHTDYEKVFTRKIEIIKP